MFEGPSVFAADRNLFPEKLADAMVPAGHMAMISDHFYVMGNDRDAEEKLEESRAHFLSNDSDTRFEKAFAAVGSKLMAKGIPYRIDELNNWFKRGAKGVSDTYTAARRSMRGLWTGQWKAAETGSTQNPTIKVAPTSLPSSTSPARNNYMKASTPAAMRAWHSFPGPRIVRKKYPMALPVNRE